MSGSSGVYSGNLSISDTDISCELLKFEAQIVSPNPVAVVELKIGDILPVTTTTGSGTQELKVLTGTGQVVGGLLAHKMPRLRECILQQHSYTAKVLSINQGQVRVWVEYN